MKKIIAVLLVLIMVGCGSEPIRNYPVPAMQASPAVSNSISVSGRVESTESRNVYTTLGFMVADVLVEVGDYVTEGQTLAILDSADLMLRIEQQEASINQMRDNSANMIQESQRMLNEATSNLANNTNMHILSAEASLNAANTALEAAQRSYDDALRDYQTGTNPQVVSAESFLRSARVELDRIEALHANVRSLSAAGVASTEELRQSENALTHARNQYNDARLGYENAKEFQGRTLDQLQIALQSAITARQSAQELLNASRIASQQEIERLRSNVTSAELTAAGIEPMEISLRQLKRHLDDSTITAPISGAVTSVIAREGAVGMGLLFVVEDTNNLRIITSFREYDIDRISPGMEATIRADATGTAVYRGVITRISPAASPHSPVVEFETELAVVDADTNLRIGMTVRLELG